jgi:methylated-DNA-[protein]-cysteine S-methyltransferase
MPAAITNDPLGAGFALFDTSLGRCAIAWCGGRVVRSALPDEVEARTLARFDGFERREPPPFAGAAIAAIVALLAGEDPDMTAIDVDLDSAPDFDRRVYEAARRIPRGEVRTYGGLASEIGTPGAAQAVGLALGRNPVPIIIPCHRILAGGGRSGGFSAPGGVRTKFALLGIEGARRPEEGPGLFEALPLAVKPRG